VAVPFVLAAGFVLAGLTMMLSQRFGSLTAYWVMAGAYASPAFSPRHWFRRKSTRRQRGRKVWYEVDCKRRGRWGDHSSAHRLLGSVFAIPGGPATALSAARVIGRNWPIAVLLVLIGGPFWPTRNIAAEEVLAIRLRPNGPDPDIHKWI